MIPTIEPITTQGAELSAPEFTQQQPAADPLDDSLAGVLNAYRDCLQHIFALQKLHTRICISEAVKSYEDDRRFQLWVSDMESRWKAEMDARYVNQDEPW